MDYNYVETCPFCGKQYAAFCKFKYNEFSHESYNTGTSNSYLLDIDECISYDECEDDSSSSLKNAYKLTISRCTFCNQEKITIEHFDKTIQDDSLIKNVRPKFTGISFPDYVPLPIRQDYEEACAILNFSPKASATLARRCLQGMIRDFFNIKNKDNLRNEISAIKDKVDPQIWDAIDAVRKIGNIGAHMEKDVNIILDVDTGEAEKLIGLIECLIRGWYIARHDRNEMLSDIVEIGKEKDKIKESSKSNTKDYQVTQVVTNNAPINGNNNMNLGNININNSDK